MHSPIVPPHKTISGQRPLGRLRRRTLVFAAGVAADAIGLDTAESRSAARAAVGPSIVLQGNVDPLVLLGGGPALDRAVDGVLDDFRGTPAIVNLGHGVRLDTPPEHVAQMVERVKRRG